jgi:mannose-6-phosphate isomerase
MRTTKPEQVYEERPWGNFVRLSHNEPCSVKIITVKAGKRLSLQSHNKRSELWRVLDGPMTVQLGDEIQSLQRDEEEVDGRWLEISFGDFDEDDIIRYEDDFGRG